MASVEEAKISLGKLTLQELAFAGRVSDRSAAVDLRRLVNDKKPVDVASVSIMQHFVGQYHLDPRSAGAACSLLLRL